MNQCPTRRKWLLLALFCPLAVAAGEQLVELQLVARKPRGGVRTVRLAKGDRMALSILSDEPITVHVHGYDLKAAVKPGSPASLRLDAQAVGRFPVTAHFDGHSGRKAAEPTLLYLEVHPR